MRDQANVDDRADFLVMIGAAHMLELVVRFEFIDPVPQILISHDYASAVPVFVMQGKIVKNRGRWKSHAT